MTLLRAILAEIVHLFADDGSLALALLAWTAMVGLGTWLAPALPPVPSGGALFLGCAIVLLGNVTRAGHQR